jgi:putative tricarboxylic transport membrane protein
MSRGERIFSILLGLFGLLWLVKSFGLKYSEDSVPGSGFLPFWLGLLMVALIVVDLWARRTTTAEAPGRFGRVMAIAAGLAVTVALIEPLGFTVPIAAYLLFLLRIVERQSWLASVGVAVGTSGVLLLIFRIWLSVPLPRGPWGF